MKNPDEPEDPTAALRARAANFSRNAMQKFRRKDTKDSFVAKVKNFNRTADAMFLSLRPAERDIFRHLHAHEPDMLAALDAAEAEEARTKDR